MSRKATITIECQNDDAWFKLHWNEITKEEQASIPLGGLFCNDFSNQLGNWCRGCGFCLRYSEETT